MTTEAGQRGGQPGNQNAVRAKRFRNALERALARKGHGDIEEGLNKLATKLVSCAEKGESWAMREVADRIDGKVPQAVEMTGEGGGAIVVRDANTSVGVARRLAFVLAQGALAKALESSKAAESPAPEKTEGGSAR